MRFVWAAINPDDDEEFSYDVEALDPAQEDRFHVQVEVPYKPDIEWFRNKFGKRLADSAVSWWNELPSKVRCKVTPRRLEYALNVYGVKGNLRHVLPGQSNISKLSRVLNDGPIQDRLDEIYKDKDKKQARKFISVENNYRDGLSYITKDSKLRSFFVPLFEKEKISNLMAIDTKIYKFEKIKRAKRAALDANPDKELFDLGVGEPDQMADPGVVKTLQLEAEKPENRGYTDNGIDEFKTAACQYMKKVFSVEGLDPNKHVNHLIGAKPGLAMTPAVFINPGDVILMTVPGYPVMGTHAQYLGGEVVNLPLTEENDFLPDLKAIDAEGLFPEVTTWLGFPKDRVLRGYMEDFIHLFAPHYPMHMIRDAAGFETQKEVDELLKGVPLPVRGGCEDGADLAASVIVQPS